jgi:hypothetical protein
MESSLRYLFKLVSIWLLFQSVNRSLSMLVTALIISSPYWMSMWNRLYIYTSTLIRSPYQQEYDLFSYPSSSSSSSSDQNMTPHFFLSKEKAHQRVKQHTEMELEKLRQFMMENKEEVNDRFLSSPSRILIGRFVDGDYSGIPFHPPTITSPSQLDVGEVCDGEWVVDSKFTSRTSEWNFLFDFSSMGTWLSIGILVFAVYVCLCDIYE